MKRGNALRAAAILALALVALSSLLPWKSWLETRLKGELAARGVSGLSFTISSVGLHSVTFRDIAFGEAKLPELTAAFGPLELLQGNLRALRFNSLSFRQGDITVTLHDFAASLAPGPKGWQGTWQTGAIEVKGAALPVPPLTGKGSLSWQNPHAALSGTLASADNAYRAAFALDYPDRAGAILRIGEAAAPWNGGVVSLTDAAMPLNGEAPIILPLRLQRVSLGALMQAATGSRAAATGAVSGTLPLRVGRDGALAFQHGALKADEAGTITLQPDAIPGDNAQVALVREVLQNFHYSEFSMGVDSGKDNKLSMLLSLQGNNPDVYNGRQINLNVHLTGDVIEMLQQSVASFDDPKQLLKQGSHAK